MVDVHKGIEGLAASAERNHTPDLIRVEPMSGQLYRGNKLFAQVLWWRDGIAETSDGNLDVTEAREFSAFIVRAVNSHQYYLDALELIAGGIADPAGIAAAALEQAER